MNRRDRCERCNQVIARRIRRVKIMNPKSVNAQYGPEGQDLIDKPAVASLLGVSVRTVDSLMARGKIPYFKLSERCVRFRRSDVLDHLAKTCRIAG